MARASRSKRRGIALFIVMGVILVVFLLAFGMIGIVRNEVRLTANLMDGMVAFYLAEAGLEQAMFVLKRDLHQDDKFIDAMIYNQALDIKFSAAALDEVAAILPFGKGEVKLEARYEPDEDQDFGKARLGRLVIHSQGVYNTPQGFTAKKQIRAVVKVTGINLGIVAPEHGLFIRDPRPQLYEAPNFTLDARDFAVMGGNIFLNGGMRCELTTHIIRKEFRPMGELGLLDLGYDAFNLATWFSGGVNFTHSPVIEYSRASNPVTRKYFNFEGLGALLGPGAAWRAVEEPYMPGRTRRATRFHSDESINLMTAEQYKELATTKVDPYKHYNPDGDPRDNFLFKTIVFSDIVGARSTAYPNVLPLYGWGDWRRVPAVFYQNPTRKQDLSQAIAVDGITYVRGDVFLEGWYKGIGTLVVQGNVYLGGDVLGLPPPVTGYQSLLNIVCLEDPKREGVSGGKYNRNTGKVIYMPHHDRDWDKLHLHLMRELSPTLDIAIYAKNGMEVDRSSIFNKFFNMDIEFNFVSEIFDWQKLPNDMVIYGSDPQVILQREGVDPQKAFLQPVIGTEYLSWTEERATL